MAGVWWSWWDDRGRQKDGAVFSLAFSFFLPAATSRALVVVVDGSGRSTAPLPSPKVPGEQDCQFVARWQRQIGEVFLGADP